MKTLTLHRPWPWAVFYSGKFIENRSWPPPKSLIGQPLAIHAGATYDQEGHDWIETTLGIFVPPEEEHPTGVIGTVKLVDVVTKFDSPWFVGPYGWLFGPPQPFDEPVPCRGAQGLWDWEPPSAQGAIEDLANHYAYIYPLERATPEEWLERAHTAVTKRRMDLVKRREFNPNVFWRDDEPLKGFLERYCLGLPPAAVAVHAIAMSVWGKFPDVGYGAPLEAVCKAYGVDVQSLPENPLTKKGNSSSSPSSFPEPTQPEVQGSLF